MKWVLVDISWLAYRALHAVGDLEFEAVPTGIIFGFFQQLREICLNPRVRSNKVLIFCDSRHSYRAQEYPEYKGKRREERPQEEQERVSAMRQQMDNLSRNVLPEMGFPVYSQDGLESDDLIAHAAREMTERRERGIMITSDGDLLQCITPHISWFDPQRDKWHNVESFIDWKGVHPNQWGEVKALGGCSSDNVRGVPGVGEGTALRYLLRELPPHFKSHQAIISEEGRRVRRRNRRLVVLPHEKTKPFEVEGPDYHLPVFLHYCEKYGLLSFLRDKKAWSAFFSGSLFKTRKRGEL